MSAGIAVRVVNILNDRILCEVPFSSTFPTAARKLGGRPRGCSNTWIFDRRDEAKVRELCVQFFGTDGSDDAAAAPEPGSILPMQINVIGVVRMLVAQKCGPWAPANPESDKKHVLSYFAQEDRERVAPVVDAVFAEKFGGKS